jgi:Ni/Co efflux regulator RcnB
MKSLTIALMLAALAIPGAAFARDHDGRGQGPGGGYRPEAGPGGGYRGPAGPGPGGYPQQRGYQSPPLYRGPSRYENGPAPWGEYAPPPQPYGAGPARWRRGQFFPPSMRGGVVDDYQRYHLRRPPPGYYWYRSGDDFVLAALSSGLIFEVVGGGY